MRVFLDEINRTETMVWAAVLVGSWYLGHYSFPGESQLLFKP